MIRSRLRVTLLMVLAVVIGLGLSAILLVRSNTTVFARLIDEEYRAIKAADSILFHASLLQSHALQAADPGGNPNLAAANPVIEQSAQVMREMVGVLNSTAKGKGEHEAVAELAALVESMLTGILQIVDPIAKNPAGLNQIADSSGSIGRLCRRIVAVNEARILQVESRSSGMVFNAAWYVAVLTAVALLILVVIFKQFNTLALRPLARLTESVREVENRNFQLSLPVRRDDEIGQLSIAYNDMASELRRLYQETDQHIIDLNARNRALLSAFPHAVIVLRDDGSLLQVNPEAEHILESQGTPDRLPAKLRRLFERASATGKNLFAADLDQALLFRIGDREHYFLPRVFRLPPVEDMEPAWGIILTDVSRFRWLDDMKMNVLATVSHEIKTPLTSIRMVLHLLLEQKTGKLTELQEEMVQSASDDCERLLETLGNLLQLGRLTSGSKHLNLTTVEPRTLFEPVPLSLRDEAGEKGVTLQIDAHPDLPLVKADESRIAQVVTNLLSNAIKFSPPSAEVVLKAEKQDSDHVRFTIIDHGPGIPPESQDKLFERFYRDPGQSVEGTGLGLSIAREIINAHNGRIGFQSDAGQPTAFYFDLLIA